MNNNKLVRGLSVVSLISTVAACQSADDVDVSLQEKVSADVQQHLDALPSARVAAVDGAGIPNFVAGDLGKLRSAATADDVDLGDVVTKVAPVFRADARSLTVRRSSRDFLGDLHVRLQQHKNGLEVIGGELVVHARNGAVFAANGTARDDLPAPAKAEIRVADALSVARDSAASLAEVSVSRDAPLAYYLADDKLDLVYKVEVSGAEADGTPVRDTVLVNAVDGSITLRIPHIHSAKKRTVYNLKNRTTLSQATLARSEGGAASTDAVVNSNYDLLGTVYDCYSSLFGRDSINGAGSTLKSYVHYSKNYNNAYWDGTEMVYGDGDGSTFSNLANSLDVTAHELTHGVTSFESNLTYSGESGGLNESLSDIFGNVCEWFRDGKVVSANTWKVGEDVFTPSKAGDALRYLNDPAKDGASVDFYSSTVGSKDVHYSSGLPNLVFFLLSEGGTHPRGKSTVNVTGIGIEKAAQVFYLANTSFLTSSSKFAAARTATLSAAQQLGLSQAEIDSVTNAWAAVGVGSPAQ